MKTLLTLAVGLILVGPAHAEYRIVLIRVHHAKDGKQTVTIRSDVKADRTEAASVDDACKAVKQMTGWGSAVGVHIVSDGGVLAPVDPKLLRAILDNWQMNLVSVDAEIPKGLSADWLKAVGDTR
jgi:hypothetical protein